MIFVEVWTFKHSSSGVRISRKTISQHVQDVTKISLSIRSCVRYFFSQACKTLSCHYEGAEKRKSAALTLTKFLMPRDAEGALQDTQMKITTRKVTLHFLKSTPAYPFTMSSNVFFPSFSLQKPDTRMRRSAWRRTVF